MNTKNLKFKISCRWNVMTDYKSKIDEIQMVQIRL